MNIEEIRKIPITDFLARMGHEPTARKGNEWWYSAPYREERTPSFRVNILKNVWQDFGIGRGGDIFSLAGEFTGSGDFKSQAVLHPKPFFDRRKSVQNPHPTRKTAS